MAGLGSFCLLGECIVPTVKFGGGAIIVRDVFSGLVWPKFMSSTYVVPLFNARHHTARLARPREHKDLSVEDWKQVAWSGLRWSSMESIPTTQRQWEAENVASGS
ncbi:hypothetical protein TNCV_1333071 [Trichonephila clavipes]|nr:hypothetical protein TNCV_1333071 [Trichonephila clavipes]